MITKMISRDKQAPSEVGLMQPSTVSFLMAAGHFRDGEPRIRTLSTNDLLTELASPEHLPGTQADGINSSEPLS